LDGLGHVVVGDGIGVFEVGEVRATRRALS